MPAVKSAAMGHEMNRVFLTADFAERSTFLNGIAKALNSDENGSANDWPKLEWQR
jgi:hypothetical protein